MAGVLLGAVTGINRPPSAFLVNSREESQLGRTRVATRINLSLL